MCKCNLQLLLVWVVFSTLVVGGCLDEVYKEDLLGKVKVTVSRSFPDQESLHWGDGNIIHEHMDHFHLNHKHVEILDLDF